MVWVAIVTLVFKGVKVQSVRLFLLFMGGVRCLCVASFMLKPTQQEVDVFSEGFPQGHLVNSFAGFVGDVFLQMF